MIQWVWDEFDRVSSVYQARHQDYIKIAGVRSDGVEFVWVKAVDKRCDGESREESGVAIELAVDWARVVAANKQRESRSR